MRKEIKVKDKNKNSKIQWSQILIILFFMLIGAVCGVFMVKYVESTFEMGRSAYRMRNSAGGIALSVMLLIIAMYAAMFIQIIIHEAGHLFFGLITGYRFSSFRIGSLMWIKENEKLRFRRLTIAGMGGQCLMTPPDIKDGKIPFILYNLGGSIINFLSAMLFFGLSFLFGTNSVVSTLFLMLTIFGAAFALLNGIPMRLGTVDNDGYNALSLGKNDEARRSFWVQMKMNEQVSKGIRLKDMPDEWFVVPSAESMKNSMSAAIGVFACNRLMDKMEFEKADKLMAELLEMDTGIVGLHRSLIIGDRIYFELVGANRKEKLDQMLDKQHMRFIKSMKSFPSVLRTKYAYALLAENDKEKAERIKLQFKKYARTYPHSGEIAFERELMAFAEQKYAVCSE